MSANHSGFTGYTMANIYPQWGSGVTQNLDTTPEPEEQVAYVSTDSPAQPAIDTKSKVNMWLLIGGLVILMILFSK